MGSASRACSGGCATPTHNQDSQFSSDIDNQSQVRLIAGLNEVRLDELPLNESLRITAVDWDMLSIGEARRLREFGFDAGTEVETLHRGWFLFDDPIAVRVGRMTVAIRRAHAAAIQVEPA